MEPKQNYLLIGLFVVIAVLGLAGFVAWLAGNSDKREYALYRTYFTESVTGLSEGGSVRFRGVEVGKIKDIAIDASDATRIVITMRLAKTTPITTETVAMMKSLGITGLAYIELSGGTKDAPPLAANDEDEIPVIRSQPSTLSQLTDQLPAMLDKVSGVVDKIALVLNEENAGHVSATLANLERLSAGGDNPGEVAEALRELKKAMAQLSKTAETLNVIAAGSQQDIHTALQETSRAMVQLAALVERTNRFSETGYRETAATLAELKKTARDMGELTRSLKEDPSRVVIREKSGGVKMQ